MRQHRCRGVAFRSYRREKQVFNVGVADSPRTQLPGRINCSF